MPATPAPITIASTFSGVLEPAVVLSSVAMSSIVSSPLVFYRQCGNNESSVPLGVINRSRAVGLERNVSFLLYKLVGQEKPALGRSRGRRVPVFGRRHSK